MRTVEYLGSDALGSATDIYRVTYGGGEIAYLAVGRDSDCPDWVPALADYGRAVRRKEDIEENALQDAVRTGQITSKCVGREAHCRETRPVYTDTLQVDGQRVHHFERHRLRWVAAVAEYDIIGERLPVRVTRWTLRLMPTEDGPNGVVFI